MKSDGVSEDELKESFEEGLPSIKQQLANIMSIEINGVSFEAGAVSETPAILRKSSDTMYDILGVDVDAYAMVELIPSEGETKHYAGLAMEGDQWYIDYASFNTLFLHGEW